MNFGGMNIPGSLGPSYFKALKEEEARHALVGMQAISTDTLYGATGKALGDVYGERMRSLRASHQQKYGQQQLDIGERRLAIEEEAQKDREKAQMWAGIGTLAGTAAAFIPGVGPLVSGAIGATTRALTTTKPLQPWIQPSQDEYYGGTSQETSPPAKDEFYGGYGATQGVESQWPSEARYAGATQESTTSTGENIWPSETRFMKMGSQLLFGSGMEKMSMRLSPMSGPGGSK